MLFLLLILPFITANESIEQICEFAPPKICPKEKVLKNPTPIDQPPSTNAFDYTWKATNDDGKQFKKQFRESVRRITTEHPNEPIKVVFVPQNAPSKDSIEFELDVEAYERYWKHQEQNWFYKMTHKAPVIKTSDISAPSDSENVSRFTKRSFLGVSRHNRRVLAIAALATAGAMIVLYFFWYIPLICLPLWLCGCFSAVLILDD